VAAQDAARSLHEAKQSVVARFGVTWQTVDQIEKEGVENDWPPLGRVLTDPSAEADRGGM
jgi:hypothetical protein